MNRDYTTDSKFKMNEDPENKRPYWNTANKGFYRRYKDERKRLKDNLTPAEITLWEYLRNKKLGVKFRRQHIIDFYIPDFVALSIKLIIEVDGEIHLKKKREDEERNRRLEAVGFKIVRFTNEEIEDDIESVLKRIKMEIEKLTSPNLSKGEEQES